MADHGAPPDGPRRRAALVPGWKPSPLVAASVGLHATAFAAGAACPALIGWSLAALAANHAALTIPTLVPRDSLLGPNILRLPGTVPGRMALTFDDGPDPRATPAILDMLDERGARATFFCVGRNAAAFPALAREILRRGHAVENHSQTHPKNFPFMSPRALRAEIGGAQDRLSDIVGVAPTFFRAPMGFHSPLIDPVLHPFGLRLVTWSRRAYDTVERNPATVLRRLGARLAPGDILLMHDANAAVTRDGRRITLAVLPALLDRIAGLGLRSVTLTDAFAADAPPAPAPLELVA